MLSLCLCGAGGWVSLLPRGGRVPVSVHENLLRQVLVFLAGCSACNPCPAGYYADSTGMCWQTRPNINIAIFTPQHCNLLHIAA